MTAVYALIAVLIVGGSVTAIVAVHRETTSRLAPLALGIGLLAAVLFIGGWYLTRTT